MRITAIGAHESLPQNPSDHSDGMEITELTLGPLLAKNLKTQRTQRTAAERAEDCFIDVDDLYGGWDRNWFNRSGAFFLFDVVFLYPPRFFQELSFELRSSKSLVC